jgi:hypothetical protein
MSGSHGGVTATGSNTPNLRGSHPQVQEQAQHPKSSSSETHGASRPSLQNATPAVSGCPASLQITHGRIPGPKGRPSEPTGVNSKPRRVPDDDVSECTTEYHAKFVAPHSSSEGEVSTRLELERQLSVLLGAQTERDQRIAQLTDELALKSALLEQAEVNVTEAKKHEGLKLRELSRDQHVRAFVERRLRALCRKQHPAPLTLMSGINNVHASRLGNMKRNLQMCVPSSRQRSPNWRQSVYDSRTRRRV